MAIAKILTDHTGRVLKPGRTEHKLSFFPVNETALPSWITFESGQLTVTPASAGRPGLLLAEPGAAHEKVFFGGTIDRTNLVAARLDLHGVRSMGTQGGHIVYVRLDDEAITNGAVLSAQAADVGAGIVSRPPTTTAPLTHQYHTVLNQYDADPANWQHYFRGADIGLMVNFEQKTTWAFEGNEVVGYKSTPEIARTGTLRPRLQYQGSTSTPLLVQGVTLSLWYN